MPEMVCLSTSVDWKFKKADVLKKYIGFFVSADGLYGQGESKIMEINLYQNGWGKEC